MLEWEPVPQPDEERQNEIIEKFAQWVHEHELDSIALFLGEMSKPVAFVESSLVHFLSPFIGVYALDDYTLAQIGYALEDRNKIERFLCRLEELNGVETSGRKKGLSPRIRE